MKEWHLTLGAHVRSDGVQFRVWAPDRMHVDVIFENRSEILQLVRDRKGYFSGIATWARPGDLYRYRLDDRNLFPDPCSRYQPQGPHGASMIIDSRAFPWTDHAWNGMTLAGQIFYEVHIGTFTTEGTFDAASRQLAELQRLGVTTIELMPVHEWAGQRNWGYDGVGLYAPEHVYGKPEALKRFVNKAHGIGLGVLLDVVYNHMGPDGCYLKQYAKAYFSNRYRTAWGDALNFDGPMSTGVRDFFIQNACYWLNEFHLDGLRFDATQKIQDQSPRHVLGEMTTQARRAARPRPILLIAEDEDQNRLTCMPVPQGGYGMDATWSDDFHHSARVALTGYREGYFKGFKGTPQELVSVAKYGYLHQAILHREAASFVFYIQNHDQVANVPSAKRLSALTSPGRYQAITALLLLLPQTPLLFMGQEFGASSPFTFFVDHNKDLAPLIWSGRKKFFAQFPSFMSPRRHGKVPNPSSAATFQAARLNFQERQSHAATYRFHKDLLWLRRRDSLYATSSVLSIDGAVLGPEIFIIRLFGRAGDDRLLAVNLGCKPFVMSNAEPLLAPAPGREWLLAWTNARRRKASWVLPGESTSFYKGCFCKNRRTRAKNSRGEKGFKI